MIHPEDCSWCSYIVSQWGFEGWIENDKPRCRRCTLGKEEYEKRGGEW